MVLIIGITSCSKTVTPRKLDGDWDVTSGTTEDSWIGDDYSRTTTSTFNGSTVTSTTTEKIGNNSETDGSTTDMTISYSFDRKSGEYSSTMVGTNEDVDFSGFSYYIEDTIPGSDAYIYGGTYERVATRTSTTNESGLFTITGGAGEDIEENSQVVFQMMTQDVSYTETYLYYDEDSGDEIDRRDMYIYDWEDDDYDNPSASDEGSESYTGSSSESMVWDVVEMDKETMTVEWMDETIYVDGTDADNNFTSTTSVSWTLTAK